MNAYRHAADEEAMSLKDPYIVLDQLHALYRKFDVEERAMANQVLAEWALSDEEKVRFVALVLIDDFRIETAILALRELATHLASTKTPGAPFELEKVNRIIRDLSGKQ